MRVGARLTLAAAAPPARRRGLKAAGVRGCSAAHTRRLAHPALTHHHGAPRPPAPRLDRWAAGDPYGVYRLLSLVFGFGTALFSTAAVIGQTRALIAGATRSLSAALAGVYGAPYAFFQVRNK